MYVHSPWALVRSPSQRDVHQFSGNVVDGSDRLSGLQHFTVVDASSDHYLYPVVAGRGQWSHYLIRVDFDVSRLTDWLVVLTFLCQLVKYPLRPWSNDRTTDQCSMTQPLHRFCPAGPELTCPSFQEYVPTCDSSYAIVPPCRTHSCHIPAHSDRIPPVYHHLLTLSRFSTSAAQARAQDSATAHIHTA
jgi:hypothetical protein